MTCTDDDLKRLKEHGLHCGFRVEINSLIARLEAAEELIPLAVPGIGTDAEDEFLKLFEAWKKAAGK